MRRAIVLIAVFGSISATACGTGAPPAGGSENLPNALLGPFRTLQSGETTKAAPHVLDSSPWDHPSAIDTDGDPSTMGVTLYVATGSMPRQIRRFDLPDVRTGPTSKEEMSSTTTLAADAAWEDRKAGVSEPFVLRVRGEIWLYYASGGCIGRAVSSDGGRTFTKDSMPALCGDATSAWEDGTVGAPSVHVAFDGSYRLLYASANRIGEARSSDGTTFTRMGDPVLAPVAADSPAPMDGGVDDLFDDVSVGDPSSFTLTSPTGRPITYVFYTGVSRTGAHVIGLAARTGDDGPFTRNPVPALNRFDMRAPTIVRFSGFTMLYAAGSKTASGTSIGTAVISAAIAPAETKLPAIATDGGVEGGG